MRHGRRAAWVLLSLTLSAVFAVSVRGAERDPVEKVLDARLRLVYRAQREASTAARGEATAGAGSRAQATLDRLLGTPRSRVRTRGEAAPRQSLLVRYSQDCHSLEGTGFRLQAQVGPICTGTLAPERLADLARFEGVRFVSSAAILRAVESSGLLPQPLTSPAAVSINSLLSARTDQGAASALATPRVLSGAGALVAFIDTGVDVFHQDFRKPDGSTRIKYLLDLSDPGDTDGDGDLDGTGPFGGTLYSEGQINASLLSGSMRERDSTGHGTHGLSIAAGDDPSFPGMAPSADLLVVKATRDDGTLGFVSTDVINALVFVDQKAEELGLPYVVNLSLGTIVAPHDGRSLEEQAIDTLVGPGRPGKVAVLAAGNSSDNRSSRFHHLGGTAYTGLSNTHTLTVPAFTANPGPGNDRIFLDVWYKGRDKLTVTVTPPGGSPVTAAFGNYLDLETPQGNVFIANLGGPSLENGDVEALVLIDDWAGTAPAPGNWTISFQGEEIGDTGEYHAWLADDSQVGSVFPYLSANADNRYLIGKPGSAINGITVGSYSAHDPTTRFRTAWTDVNNIARSDASAVLGDISDFSSTGRTRDGRVKPEITAPGERVLGAVSKDAFPGVAPNSIYRFHPFAEPTGLLTDASPDHAFGLLQGTSFSAPVVAGLAARILSTNPTLDAIQVRNVLINSATTDIATGAVPNDEWGYGKVSLTVGGGTLPGNLRITTDSLPNGVLNEAYDQVLSASGGTLAYSWSLASGSLPTGLTLDATGHIAGTVTSTGTFNLTARVTDSSAPAQVVTRALSITVSNTAPLEILTLALPPADLSKTYDQPLEATGGTPPYTWSLAGGSLPPGLSVLPAGQLRGDPTTLGRFNFTVRVQDAAAGAAFRSIRVKVTRNGAETWEELGAEASSVNYIAIDPSNAQRVLASTDNTGDPNQNAVFESLDGGESWRAISINNGFFDGENFYYDQVDWLAVNPANSVVWAAKGSGTLGQGDILRYNPATSSWITSRTDCGDHAVIDFDASGATYLFCTGSKAFRRSTDQGATWTQVGTLCGGGALYGDGVLGFLSVSRASPQYMYVVRDASGGDYTCRSNDGGATWVEAGRLSSTSFPFPRYTDIQVSQTNPLDVVRGINQNGPGNVERSLDGGVTWTPYLAPAPFTLLRRAPSDPSVLLIGSSYGSGPFRSTNHGQTWTPLIVKGIPNLRVSSFAFDETDANRFYVGTDQGLFYTADGGVTWSRKNRGLMRRTVTGLAMSRTAPDVLLLTTTAFEPYLTRNGGAKWTAGPTIGSPSGLTQPVISEVDPGTYFVVNEFFGLQRSDDRGVTWSLVLSGTNCASCSMVKAVAADPFDANNLLAAVAGNEMYRTTNRGLTWTPIVPPVNIDFSGFSYARDVPGRVYGAWNSGAGIYRSGDGGVTWAPFGLNGLGAGAPWVTHVVAAPSNSEYVYAATAIGQGTPLHFRDPAVGSWQVATTAPTQTVLSLAVDWANPLLAYAGIDHPGTPGGQGGIYRTVDGGRNWTRMPGLLDGFDVIAITIHPTEAATLVVATADGGAYRSPDGGATWVPLDTFGTIGDVVNVTIPHPSTSSLLFAGTEGYGVQFSRDAGLTFAPRVAGLANVNVNALAFEPGSETVLYVGTDAGVFKSINTGTTWAATAQAGGEITDLIADNDGVARRIWATVRGQGVAYSADGGTTFTLVTNGLASLDLTSLELETVGVARRIWATTRGGDGVSFSDDLGQTWRSAAGSGFTDRNVNDFTHESGVARRIWGTARRIWATTDSGVFYSDNDGLSWSELSLGLPSRVPVSSVSIDANTNEVMVSLFSDREGGVYRGANLSGVWSAFNDGLDELKVKKVTNDGGRVVNATTKATTFYAATSGDGAYQTDVQTQSASSPTITTSTLATGKLRSAYFQTLTASGGIPPYAWSLPEGFLPPGLNLNVSTGVVSGDPGQGGTFSFSAQVKDAEGKIDRKALSIVVDNPLAPAIASFSPTSGKPGTSVILTGARFSGATSVAFAGTPALFSVSSDAMVQTAVPSGAAPGPISVTTSQGTGRSATDFLVFEPRALYTVTPCRVVDTREPAGPTGGPALAAGQDRTFVLRGACDVPSTARAVSANITVTQPTDAGDLRVFPAGTELPLVSSINYSPGQTRANNAILTLGSGGAVTLHCDQATGSVHLILDVNGFFQ